MFENDPAVEFTRAKRGLVLVTEPTRCGKSTTLTTLVDTVNRTRRDHILTIEDPIEYVREGKIDYEAAKPYIYEKSTHDTIRALRR